MGRYSLDDAIGAAMVGLTRAGGRWRQGPGMCGFKRYALIWIRKHLMLLGETDGHLIRKPFKVKKHAHPTCDIEHVPETSLPGYVDPEVLELDWRHATGPAADLLRAVDEEADRAVLWLCVVHERPPAEAGRIMGRVLGRRSYRGSWVERRLATTLTRLRAQHPEWRGP